MWTPRRILLLLAGFVGFGVAYSGYTYLLGSVDGLPQLPAKLLVRATGEVLPPPEIISPTDQKLFQAFGPNCPESNYSAYPTKIHILENNMVLAAGRPQWGQDGSRYVTFAPCSVAIFGKERDPREMTPEEVQEISTIHADKAILEFDQPVGNERDMLGGKAKLIGVELRSDPTPYSTDPRTGRIHITNNQHSDDPNKSLIFKTIGPVYYRVADPSNPSPNAPDIWTTAAVQVDNRENMPRPLRGTGLPSVPVASSGVSFATDVVSEMILGSHTPPPTITAEGLKIYLKPAPPAQNEPGSNRKRGPASAGVRQIELSENVLMNLWVSSGSGFPGTSESSGTPAATAATNLKSPPMGVSALAGSLVDGRAMHEQLTSQALVQIRTLGSFKFDYETNTARFEVAPESNPNLPNHIEVTRLSPLGPRDYLVCQLLELELDRPLTQGGVTPAPGTAKGPSTGTGFKSIRATGPHVYISAEQEQLEAQGTVLHYRTGLPDPDRPGFTRIETVLQGAPLLAVRDRNKLEAGSIQAPGTLTMLDILPPAGAKEKKETRSTVNGPGRIEIIDTATTKPTLRASWTKTLEYGKDKVGDKDLDLFVFTGAGTFTDPKGEFDLTSDTMKLWLDPGRKTSNTAASSSPLPFRLQGIGNVRGKSAETVIRDTDRLNVMFADVEPRVPPQQVVASRTTEPTNSAIPPKGAAGEKAATTPPLLEDAPPRVAEQPKPNPLHMSAESIEVWVVRYPLAGRDQPKPGAEPTIGGSGLKYELDRARCDGRVIVHQDPADPQKSPRGTDITANTLHLAHFPTGHAMTVVGTEEILAEVHFEELSIAGPKVVIDQPNNLVQVTGKGWLRLPNRAPGDQPGGSKSADMTVIWQEQMRFHGERRNAEFIGQVQAEQRTEPTVATRDNPDAEPTWSRSFAVCHRMELTLDRPVYFNQLKPKSSGVETPKPINEKNEKAKVEMVVCLPAPEDGEMGRPRKSSPVVFAEETISVRTGKHVKAHWIQSRLLEMTSEETRTLVSATGPGESRVLQMGSKNDNSMGLPAQTAQANQSTSMKATDDQEMKLTVVRFAGKLRLEDRKGIFQQAIYEESIRVVHLPSDNLALPVDEHSVPAQSVMLRCSDTLTVSSYKSKDGGEPQRRMDAIGAAKMQDDQYIGDGHTISYDGNTIILRGYGDDPASLRRRVRALGPQDFHSGREIRYDTQTGRVNAIDSSGGRITTPR